MPPSSKGIQRRSPKTSWLETLVQGASACKRLACEQALRGALAAGREEEEALSTTYLEFEYLHGKSRCEVMIGEDDISNDVITLGTCRVNICLHSRSLPSRADWRKSDSPVDRGATGELVVEFKFQRRSRRLSFLFPPRHPPQVRAESLLAG